MDGSAGGVEEDTHSGVLSQTCKNRQIIAHGPGQREWTLQRTERESGSDRAERTEVQSGDVRTFSQNTIKITSHVYDQNFILGRVELRQGRHIPKVVTTWNKKKKRFNLKKCEVARYPWFAEGILQHLVQPCKQGPPLFKTSLKTNQWVTLLHLETCLFITMNVGECSLL